MTGTDNWSALVMFTRKNDSSRGPFLALGVEARQMCELLATAKESALLGKYKQERKTAARHLPVGERP